VRRERVQILRSTIQAAARLHWNNQRRLANLRPARSDDHRTFDSRDDSITRNRHTTRFVNIFHSNRAGANSKQPQIAEHGSFAAIAEGIDCGGMLPLRRLPKQRTAPYNDRVSSSQMLGWHLRGLVTPPLQIAKAASVKPTTQLIRGRPDNIRKPKSNGLRHAAETAFRADSATSQPKARSQPHPPKTVIRLIIFSNHRPRSRNTSICLDQ